MPYAKGQSGNPSGRPKGVLELIQLARTNCRKAIDTAVALLDHEDARVQLSAATFIRDTGMGKPRDVDFDLATLSDQTLLEEVRRRGELAARREAAVGGAVGAGDSAH